MFSNDDLPECRARCIPETLCPCPAVEFLREHLLLTIDHYRESIEQRLDVLERKEAEIDGPES